MFVSAARRLAPAGTSPAPAYAPLVIAHRGATRRAPENSLAAFEAAIAAGADMVELDVRLTADGVLVVHHDSTARGIPISRLTYQQLRERREAMTTLSDAAALCRSRISVDIEIKTPGIEARVVELVMSTLDPGQVVVTSLHAGVIAAIKTLEPRLVCGLLLGPGHQRVRTELFSNNPFDWLERSNADFVLPHQLLIPLGRATRPASRPALLRRLSARGTPVVVWTVNGPDRIFRYLKDPRIAGVITDVPEVAAEVRELAGLRSERGRLPVTGRSGRTFPDHVRPDTSE